MYSKLLSMKYYNYIFIIIGVIGVIVSLLLMIESTASSYCIVGSSCAVVSQSEYSYLLGMPLWLLALAGFTLYTILGFIYVFINNTFIMKLVLLVILIGSGLSSLLASYLIYIELNVLHLICFYCTMLHVLIFTSFISSILLIRYQ